MKIFARVKQPSLLRPRNSFRPLNTERVCHQAEVNRRGLKNYKPLLRSRPGRLPSGRQHGAGRRERARLRRGVDALKLYSRRHPCSGLLTLKYQARLKELALSLCSGHRYQKMLSKLFNLPLMLWTVKLECLSI